MNYKRTHRKMERSAEERARIESVRARLRARPTPDELLASGEYEPAVPLGQVLRVRLIMDVLKQGRLQARLSLTDVSKRSGIDRAALSRLENGLQPNPTLDTLYRYAAAVGKRISWSFKDVRPKRDALRQKRAPAKQTA